MEKDQYVNVEYVRYSWLNRDGRELHQSIFIHACYQSEMELIPYEDGERLFHLSGEEVAIELRAIENGHIQEQLKKDNGFYLYDDWVDTRSREKWSALCMHCNNYGVVKKFKGKPTCELCIMLIVNHTNGRLGR